MKTLITSAILFTALAVNAIVIDLGITTSTPASQKHTLDRLNGQINIYNAAFDTDLATAVMVDSINVDGITKETIAVDIDVTGWSYLSLKWANIEQHYWVGAIDGVITFDSTSFNRNGKMQGLSGYSLFNPTTSNVPDATNTGGILAAAALLISFCKSARGRYQRS